MADRSTASTSRVGRPRTRSAHKSPSKVGKVGRPGSKSVYQSKVKNLLRRSL